jgi:hypothetical protein
MAMEVEKWPDSELEQILPGNVFSVTVSPNGPGTWHSQIAAPKTRHQQARDTASQNVIRR